MKYFLREKREKRYYVIKINTIISSGIENIESSLLLYFSKSSALAI